MEDVTEFFCSSECKNSLHNAALDMPDVSVSVWIYCCPADLPQVVSGTVGSLEAGICLFQQAYRTIRDYSSCLVSRVRRPIVILCGGMLFMA